MTENYVPTIVFILIGGIGFLVLFWIGNKLLRNPGITSRQFAIRMAGGLGLVVWLSVIIPAQFASDAVVVGSVLVVIGFPISLVVMYGFHHLVKAC